MLTRDRACAAVHGRRWAEMVSLSCRLRARGRSKGFPGVRGANSERDQALSDVDSASDESSRGDAPKFAGECDRWAAMLRIEGGHKSVDECRRRGMRGRWDRLGVPISFRSIAIRNTLLARIWFSSMSPTSPFASFPNIDSKFAIDEAIGRGWPK